MASLLAKDAYLQGLARRICAQPGPEPRGRKSGGKTQGTGAAGSSNKKRKKAQKKARERKEKAAEPKARPLPAKPPAGSGAQKPAAAQASASRAMGTPAGGRAAEPDSLFALDVLRQRLHEKIQEARGQGGAQALSPATLEKRRRRKLERERKKRKRKELRAKEKAAEAPEAPEATPPPAPEAPGDQAKRQVGLLFNKVEVGDEEPATPAQRRKEKRRKVKGNLTPLSGRNYRQLLERLQARRARLEALREQDAGRARALEARMRWTGLLYKAEGVRVRDDEARLQGALRRKEKRRAQRRRRWEKRAALVVGKMQQRQDRRRLQLRRRKAARAERRLERARRRGRVLPQDLERAGLA